MADSEWGLCKDCKWWQIEPKAAVENLTMGLCIDEKLQPFLLRVSGNSGCNRFMPGKPASLLTGVRLSCQIRCDHDMSVKAISRFAGSGRKDSGKRPEDAIQPQPVEMVAK